MRLELNILDIKDARFAEKTAISDGVLYINRSELQELLQEDERLGEIDIELAHPGDKCRILKVGDVIEPRAKTGGSGEDFPGALGKRGTVGEGSTCVLRGSAVVTSDYSETGELAGVDPNGEIIDMSGPAAEMSIYGKTHNVVVLPYPADGVSLQEYRIALKLAGLKTAVYLARAGEGLEPDRVEIYDLPPLTEVTRGMEGLPRVGYIYQLLTTQLKLIPGEPILYGVSSVDKIVPTVIHPNEVLDGAILGNYSAQAIETYAIQNHPVIKELYRRHGKDLCFVGVIITIAHHNEPDYERAANMAANIAKWVLGADGVVLTKSGGGAPEVAMARTAQRCEELGVKTAVAICHWAADISDASFGGTTIFNFPEVNAIVSMGTPLVTLTLPPVERVIGRPVTLPEQPPVGGNIKRTLLGTTGIMGQLGSSRLIAARY